MAMNIEQLERAIKQAESDVIWWTNKAIGYRRSAEAADATAEGRASDAVFYAKQIERLRSVEDEQKEAAE